MSQSVDNLAGNLKLISLQFATIQLPEPPFFYYLLPFAFVCVVIVIVTVIVIGSVSNNRIEVNSLFLSFAAPSYALSHSFFLFCRSCMVCASNWPEMMLMIMMPPRESLPNRIHRRIAYAGAALSPINRSAFCSSTMSLSTGEHRYSTPHHTTPSRSTFPTKLALIAL